MTASHPLSLVDSSALILRSAAWRTTQSCDLLRPLFIGLTVILAMHGPKSNAQTNALQPSQPRAKEALVAAQPPSGKISFSKLTVEYSNVFGHDRNHQLQILANGECTYVVPERLAERNLPALPGARQTFRLDNKKLLVLQGLLEKTDWLQAAGGSGPAFHTDADEMTLTVANGDEKHSVTCHGRRPEPYLSLNSFIQGLLEQERRYYRLNSLDARERREVCRTLADELQAVQGYPGRMFPIHDLDYSRYLPKLIEILHNPKDATREELSAAIGLVSYLRVEAEFDSIVQLTHVKNAGSQIPDSLVRFGGERAALALAEMGASDGYALWSLIRLGDVGVERIVKLAASSPENVVRAYIDHWDELPGPPDARIGDVAGQALEVVMRRGGRREYYQEYLRLCTAEPPPASGLSAQLNYLHVRADERLRFVHGWYVVADGKITMDRVLPAPEPGVTPFQLVFSAARDGDALKFRGGWRSKRREFSDKAHPEYADEGQVDLPAGANLEVMYQWGKTRRDRSNGQPGNLRIPSHFRPLYDALVVKNGQTLMRIVYVARVAAPDSMPQSLWPPPVSTPQRSTQSDR